MPDNTQKTLTPAMRADLERQPIMTQAEAEAAWARMQTDIVINAPELAEALWGSGTN